MKKIYFLSVSFFLLILSSTVFASPQIDIFIGDYLNMDVPAMVENNRVLVPIRVVSENLDCKVTWKQHTKEVVIQKADYYDVGTKTITLKLGQKQVRVRQGDWTETLYLDVAPKVVNERVLVPLRFVGEALGEVVTWDQKNQTVAFGEYYKPIQKKERVNLTFGNKKFPLKIMTIAGERFFSVKDWCSGLGWIYTVDTSTYNFGGGGLGISLKNPIRDQEIIYHSRGIQYDGINFNTEDLPYFYCSYRDDYYLPLSSLITSFQLYESKKENGDIELVESEKINTYPVTFNIAVNDDIRRISATKTYIVYKNRHYYVMPMNKTFKEYWDEKDSMITANKYNFVYGEDHLFECNSMFFDPVKKDIDAFLAE